MTKEKNPHIEKVEELLGLTLQATDERMQKNFEMRALVEAVLAVAFELQKMNEEPEIIMELVDKLA